MIHLACAHEFVRSKFTLHRIIEVPVQCLMHDKIPWQYTICFSKSGNVYKHEGTFPTTWINLIETIIRGYRCKDAYTTKLTDTAAKGVV